MTVWQFATKLIPRSGILSGLYQGEGRLRERLLGPGRGGSTDPGTRISTLTSTRRESEEQCIGLTPDNHQFFRHIKEQIKEEYMDINSLDDNRLLMQYFRKHDTDNNHKLDGLELLKAITRMEGGGILH